MVKTIPNANGLFDLPRWAIWTFPRKHWEIWYMRAWFPWFFCSFPFLNHLALRCHRYSNPALNVGQNARYPWNSPPYGMSQVRWGNWIQPETELTNHGWDPYVYFHPLNLLFVLQDGSRHILWHNLEVPLMPQTNWRMNSSNLEFWLWILGGHLFVFILYICTNEVCTNPISHTSANWRLRMDLYFALKSKKKSGS